MKTLHAPLLPSLLAALLVTLAGSATGGGDEYPPISVTAEELHWTPVPGDPGAERAVLMGDPSRAGPYVYRVRFPPHHTVPPHSHPDHRTFTVLSGVFYEASGRRFDTSALRAHPAGSFFTYTAGTMFFGESKDDPCLFQVTGYGPTGIEYADPKDDPRLKK